jgi:excinuclease ABC subunit A
MERVIGVMQRLRDAGNSLVVVEHEPQIMFAADRILDMGPGPGERGGEISFFGPPEQLKKQSTLTAEYLSGRKVATAPGKPAPPREFIELLGAAEHNLKVANLEIPLRRLGVCDRRVRAAANRR